MKRMSRHLPALMLAAAMLLSITSCGDEPRGRHHVTTDGDTTAVDTTGHHGNDTVPGDTTGHHGEDTTAATFSLVIHAERNFGYMGESLRLSATTSSPAAVTWRSTRTTAATVDDSGLVTFNNVISDDSTLIIATAGTASDTVALANRCWNVAAWDGMAWITPAYLAVHRGDTVAMTIVDSHGTAIDSHGFNAAACQWAASSRNADAGAIATVVATPSRDNGWKQVWAISGDAPQGAIITITASHHDAASALPLTVAP